MTVHNGTGSAACGVGAAMLLALAAACGGAGPDVGRGGDAAAGAIASSTATAASAPASSGYTPSPGTTTTPPVPPTSSVPPVPTDAPPAERDGDPSPPTNIRPVPVGELTGFRVYRGRTTLLEARSSGLARYNTSDSCEVPGQPCYDAPTLDKVARIDLGAPPSVPGKDTTFVTGHSNRYHPHDPGRGVFSRLQNVRTGDTVVLTTTKGTFVYAVTTALTVPFDRLTSTDEVVRVRADTVVAISCVVAPDRRSYLGNYVVVGTLRGSTPN